MHKFLEPFFPLVLCKGLSATALAGKMFKNTEVCQEEQRFPEDLSNKVNSTEYSLVLAPVCLAPVVPAHKSICLYVVSGRIFRASVAICEGLQLDKLDWKN